MDNRTTRIFTVAFVLFMIVCSDLKCGLAAVVRPRDSQGKTSVPRVVISSALYCTNYEDWNGQHHPWVCAVPSVFGGNDRRLIQQQLKSIGIASVDNSWIRQIKRPKHFLYIEIKDLKWLTQHRVRVKAYLCLDLNEDVLTEASATLYLKHIKSKWVVDSKDSLIQSGE